MKAVSAFRRFFFTGLVVVAVSLSARCAFAGKGAYVRIFNLTDKPINVRTVVDGFENERFKGDRLTGEIDARSAFPPAGSVYVEENNFISASDITFRFAQNGARPAIKVIYRTENTGYYEDWAQPDNGLFVWSAIYGFPGVGTQYQINIFVDDQKVNPARWMSRIRDDVNLADLMIPGTHDSATYNWQVPYVATQTLDFDEQLQAGVRYFDLRGGPLINGDVAAVHGDVQLGLLGFNKIFKQLMAYLDRNPNEVILIQPSLDVYATASASRRAIKKLIDDNKRYFFTENRIPTVGEARGKIVVINRLGNNDDFNYGFNVIAWTGYDGRRYAVQDEYDPDSWADKEAAIKKFFRQYCRPRSPGYEYRLNLNFLSFAGAIPPLLSATRVGGVPGMNLRTSYFLGDFVPFPEFQCVVLMDAVQDRRFGATDGLAMTIVSLNFRRYGK